MSTRLIQVLTFANVANGATVAQAHNINVNSVPKIPDYVAADAAGFAITANAAQVSVTNNSGALATVHVWLELKHSIPRELGALASLTPQPFVAASGGGGSSGGNVFAWDVGTTWDAIYTQMAAVTGPKICLVEYDPAGPRAMTARGGNPTDLNEVIFVGTSCITTQNGEGTTIAVENGFVLAAAAANVGSRVSIQSQWLSWDFSALTAPAYTTGAGNRVVWTQLGGQLAGSNTSVIFDGTVAFYFNGVAVTSGQVMTTALDTSVIEATGRSSFFGSSWLTTAGNQIAIFTDASCEWSLAQFIAGGWVIGGNASVNNFALGTADRLYKISVDAGGNVIATLAP